MTISNFFIEPADPQVDFDDLHYVRSLVFVREQQIPDEIEFDALDRQCHHVIVRDMQCRPVGTGRLSPDGRIGRMAVLKEWRRQGVGESLLRALVEKARSLGFTSITANAQLTALGFYEKYGFVREGEVFLEAGIPHQAVSLRLPPLDIPARKPLRLRPASVPASRVESIEATLLATQRLIADAGRQLRIHSRDLECGLYGQGEIVEALTRFVLRNRSASVQMLIQEPERLKGQTHPVLELAQRLPSYFLIRAPVEVEDLQYLSAFVINDRDGYLFRLLDSRYEGHWSPNLPSRNRQLGETFERVWQRSRPCTEFRVLGL